MKLPQFQLVILAALTAVTSRSVHAQTPVTGLPMAPQPVTVASSLAAKSAPAELGQGMIPFIAPEGNGRRGANGVLCQSDPASLRGGSTWIFRYKRGGTAQGVQIIHPVGRGQAIVHLNTEAVGLSTPKAWIDVGWGGGEHERIKETKAFREVFPLKEGQEYLVMSRVSAGGAFELFIDGKEVATGRVAGANPLSLKNPEGKVAPNSNRGASEFKGDNLPLVWSPGWAALIAGPVDGGENRCSAIRFVRALADPAQGKL